MQPAVFVPVPFNDEWISHDKIDIHAIYRRPILDEDGEQILDEHGVPQWDLTGGLPVRRHHDYVRKGFQYVTLADTKSLANKVVQQLLRREGRNPADFVMLRNRAVGASPWNPKLYLASQAHVDRAATDRLTTLVERIGSEAALEAMQIQNPAFQLPAHLRNIPPGGRARGQSAETNGDETATRPGHPVSAGTFQKLGPEPDGRLDGQLGATTLVCGQCRGALGHSAIASEELPDKVFCSDRCLKTALPKAAKNSPIGRQRKKAEKRRAAPRASKTPAGAAT